MTHGVATLGRAPRKTPTPVTLVRALLHGDHVDDQSTMRAIENQLPASSLNAVRDWGLTIEEIAGAIGVSSRTLLRKRAGKQQLDVAESDRLVRLARVLADADALIGDHGNAVAWMHHQNLALGNVTPLSMLATDTGVALVRQSLGAIAYGGVA